jgi:hypothetical protein
MQKKRQVTGKFPTDETGQPLDPFTGKPLISEKELKAAAKQIPQAMGKEEADRIMAERIARGDIQVKDAAKKLGASYMLIYKRAIKIDPDREYSPEGLEPKDGDIAVKGNELVWKYPYSRHREGNLLISPTLVGAWHSIFEQQEKLRAEGYKTLEETATITGLDRGGVIETRARKIQPDKRYTFDGSEPTDSSPENVIGSELVWRDPYGSTGAVGVLLHPKLVEAWQADKVEENKLREAGYKTYVEAEQLTGINRQVLEARVALIKPEQEYTFDQAAQAQDKTAIKGNKLVWRSRYSSASGTSVLIHPILAEFWKQQEEKEKELRGKGYKTIAEASEITDILKGTITGRIGKIIPSVDYLSNALKPDTDSVPTIKGNELIWRGSYQVLLHPELVEGWKAAKLKEDELRKQGYKTTEEAAQIANIDQGTTVLFRARNIEPEQNYNLQGQVPKEGEIIVKGKELVWKNPYSLTNSSGKTGILIHPQLVESWHGIDEEERELRAKGYVDFAHIETQYGINRSLVHHRLANIEAEKDYTTAGLPPQEGEASVKGKSLHWQNPQSKFILIHPALASGWHKDIQQEQILISKGFKRLKEVQETTAIERTTLLHRLKMLNPESDYSSAGLPPISTDAIVKGKELIWRSAYTDKSVLVHPELVAAWKTAVDKEKELVGQGYKASTDIAEATGLSKQQISKRAAALNDDVSLWRDPYSGKVLFHPSLISVWQMTGSTPKSRDHVPKKLIQRSSPATKIGDADESKLPEDVKQALEENQKSQRKK